MASSLVRRFGMVVALALACSLVPAAQAQADKAPTTVTPSVVSKQQAGSIYRTDGTIDIGPKLRTKDIPLDAAGYAAPAPALGAPRAGGMPTYTAGMTRTFVLLDDYFGRYRLTTYDVRYISNNVEVWVQSDLRYRNPDQSINPVHPDASDPLYVTQERVETLAETFDQKILPTDVEYFGDYAERNGDDAALPDQLGLPADYYGGPGKRVILLVSNVRDDNFYDPINNSSFIAGFFSPTLNGFAGRNIISIDSKQWNLRAEADYPATIAHEFQHLIHADNDPDEDTWANEGLSEYAEFINGYRPTPEDHRTQFSDYPENSLTQWGDQDGDPDQNFEILADYQQAYWFFLYLAGRLQAAGIGVQDSQFIKDVSRLTTDPDPSTVAIDTLLAAKNAPFRFAQVFSDFRTALLYGGTSDETDWGNYISKWQAPSGVPVAPLDLGRLRRNLNFEGYDTTGAPPYGSDYIEIGWSSAIGANTPLTFNGDFSLPTDWSTVAATDVYTPSGAVSGQVLASGHSDETDNFVIYPVTVPASGNQNLTFDTLYNIEEGWDFGVVQVTEDTVGATNFVSLPIQGTTTISNPDALDVIKAQVPGFTGLSGQPVPTPEGAQPAWVNVTYNMSAYAGKNILLAFRYITDSSSAGTIEGPPDPGWYLDNVKVGSTTLFASSLSSAAKSIWQARNKQNQFKLDFVTFADKNGAAAEVTSATVDANGDATFNLGSLLGKSGFNEAGERTVALVTVLPPTRDADLVSAPSQYADYTLSGLPPSLLTSRARPIGTSLNSSIGRPRVYPGDTFTMTVTLDNLGRNEDLQTTAASQAYVAVPLPAGTTLVAGSAEPSNLQLVENLATLGGGLPAGPGVTWSGAVTRTADLSFAIQTPNSVTVGTVYTPTAYIANAAFNASPSQLFTDLEAPVTVVSPLSLSTGTGPAVIQLGTDATYTYTLINTDDQTRDVDVQLTLPDGATLKSFAATTVSGDDLASASRASQTTIRLSVPSYIETGQLVEVKIVIGLSASYVGSTFNPGLTLLQPGTVAPYTTPVLGVAGGATGLIGRLYAPIIGTAK